QGENLSLRLAGGRTILDGRHQLHDLTIDPVATLAGQGHYSITGPDQEFINKGTLMLGDGLGTTRIAGDYRQTQTGMLGVSFDAAGDYGRILVEGKAALKGGLRLYAQPDWYEPGWRMDTS